MGVRSGGKEAGRAERSDPVVARAVAHKSRRCCRWPAKYGTRRRLSESRRARERMGRRRARMGRR
eukprot:1234675-Prymnesium_polylepis.1